MEKLYDLDELLVPYKDVIDARSRKVLDTKTSLTKEGLSFSQSIDNHLYYGFHRDVDGFWIFREWAPNANKIYLIGDFNNWKKSESYALRPVGNGNWEIRLSPMFVYHTSLYKLYVEWNGGSGERIPAYANRTVQDEMTKVFCAQVWEPSTPYVWRYERPSKSDNPLIYECHIGMSGEKEGVSTFNEFREDVLPRVIELGYDTLQIMALQEHPYYGSFGYQVSSFFALSSRFGTPEEFKQLVDEAHKAGISVIMDIVHSHSVENVDEGLGLFDGKEDLYFHSGAQGHHPAWGSRCFNYSKPQTLSFLLSNCRFWLEEYMLDGFRFDGVTSMIYWDHGLEKDFVGYDNYFNQGVDDSALVYLALANILTKELVPSAFTIAEDVSGMAGLAAPFQAGGIGFDFRMSMGVADNWIKWIKTLTDEQWSMGEMWWQLTNKRADERTISYAECHDQAMVGDKTIIFRLMDKEMYTSMSTESKSLIVDRGMALHKMIRLVTLATSGNGYLNFMGNEFGHPEWIDFPRQGNGWSYKYARRQWSLVEPDFLRYRFLYNFDRDMIHLVRDAGVLTAGAELLVQDEENKILIFKRLNCIFAFNFNPNISLSNYEFISSDGKYIEILNTDESYYGGFSRLDNGKEHFSMGERLKLYLPSRTAVVLRKVD